MGCVVFLLSLITPRLVMVFIFLLTNWFAAAFDTHLWPVLGFIFMPYTTLAYMGGVLHAGPGGGIRGLWLVLLVIAVLVDIGSIGGGGRTVRRRRRRR